MIKIEQIRTLETKVLKAIDAIRTLGKENNTLQQEVKQARNRIEELENIVSEFTADQGEMEKGIARILNNLDQLEDTFLKEKGEIEQDPTEPERKNSETEEEKSDKEELDIF